MLEVSLAIGPYDRVHPLLDGTVRIPGVQPIFVTLEPEQIFLRAVQGAQFDVCELSLSSYCVALARGESAYVAVPVFPSRCFRHSAIYVRRDAGVREPKDLEGRRVGVPEFQLTACVWAFQILAEHYGVDLARVRWVRGGLERTGRAEKIPVRPIFARDVEEAPRPLSAMLASGEIDALISPRAPSGFGDPATGIGWLFADPLAEALAWYERTRIFPIMHVLAVRRDLAERHPWLGGLLVEAFERARDIARARLAATAAPQVMLPLAGEFLRRITAVMGDDFWPYGLGPNRHVLARFLDFHHAAGLSTRRLEPEELFQPESLLRVTV